MSQSIKKVINIAVNTPGQLASPATFGTLLVITPATTFPSGNPKQFFASLTAVGAACGTNSQEYFAAEELFEQNPTLPGIYIARRYLAAAPGENLGSITATKVPATWAAISTGAIKFSIDGTLEAVTGIDFTGATTMPGVAAILQTAIAAVKTGFTVVWTGTQFVFHSGTTGTSSTVGFAVAPGSGVDLGHMAGAYQSDGAIITAGYAAETITASLTRIGRLANYFYAFGFTSEATVQNIEDAAAWAEANKRVLGYYNPDPNTMNSEDETNIGYLLQQEDYDYSFGFCDPLNPLNAYAWVSALALQLSVNFTAPNGLLDLMFNSLPGITPLPDSVTDDQYAAMDSFNQNYYSVIGGVPMVVNGVMASGMFLNTRLGIDWFANKITTDLFNYRLALKLQAVGMTDEQMAGAIQTVDGSCDAAVNVGLVANGGKWLGAPLGQYNTNDILPKGYYVFAPSVDTLDEEQRQTRIAPTISIIAVGAGAIQGYDLELNFQQ